VRGALVDSAFEKWGLPMTTAAVAGFVLGAALGLRFNFVILIPAICLGLVIAGVSGVAHGDSVWSIAGTMTVVAVALQLGYLIANVLPFIRNAKRNRARGNHSVPTGISRPI
jgi:hypothetical protein